MYLPILFRISAPIVMGVGALANSVLKEKLPKSKHLQYWRIEFRILNICLNGTNDIR